MGGLGSGGNNFIDLTGGTFDRLTVIKRGPDYVSPSGKTRKVIWLCRCGCGKEASVTSAHLRSGVVRSCGCLHREMAASRIRVLGNRKGEASARWKGDEIGYTQAHGRVKSLRGSASDHECIDCKGQAAEWSYVGGCPREMNSNEEHSGGCPYSPDPDRYVPRCKPCHRKYDAAQEAA